MSTRLEINFNRLLSRCETLAKDKNLWDWRLEKYIATLQDQLSKLKQSPCGPCKEHLNNYNKKVEFLKGIIEAEKLPTNERILATDKLPTVTASLSGAGNSTSSKELHLQTKARYQRDARRELLGQSSEEEDDFGQRKNKAHDDDDIDSLIQHHHHMQEHLAEEMLMLTKNLKESVRESGRIVRDDTKKLADTIKLADSNYQKLKKESEGLEKHTQTCSLWVWMMLAIVVMTFLFMIMFMRVVPKKTYVDYSHENVEL